MKGGGIMGCITKPKYKELTIIKLPDGANPTNSKGPRDDSCQHYKNCLVYMLQKNQYDSYFSCVDCVKASKLIRASRPPNKQKAAIAPALKKRVRSKKNSGKRMGYNVIKQENYGREL